MFTWPLKTFEKYGWAPGKNFKKFTYRLHECWVSLLDHRLECPRYLLAIYGEPVPYQCLVKLYQELKITIKADQHYAELISKQQHRLPFIIFYQLVLAMYSKLRISWNWIPQFPKSH